MLNKLEVIRKMLQLMHSCQNCKNKKVYRKCYRAYIWQCCILRRDEFEVKFGSEYYDSFKLRFKDWSEYIWNKFIAVPIFKFIPKKHRPIIINYYIEKGIKKPIHIKHHKFVSESSLEYFLSEVGFGIVDEYLGSFETIYYMKKVNLF